MSDEYDKKIQGIRVHMAIEKNEWFLLFKERDNLIKRMILSLIFIWLLMFFLALYSVFDLLTDLLLPNILWVIGFFPYFLIKIYKISIKLALKKEEVVLDTFKYQTTNIKEIELITGIDKRSIVFYLKKHGYETGTEKKIIR